MFSFLFRVCHLFLLHFAAGLAYATPNLAMLFLILHGAQTKASIGALASMLPLLLCFNILYLHAMARRMLLGPGKIAFLSAMRWRRAHTDFLLFVAGGLLILVLLIIYFADAVHDLSAAADELSRQRTDAQIKKASPMVLGQITVILFGSRLLSGIFLFVALGAWQYVCRLGIRIVAHADSYYLRTQEALDLTHGQGFKIMALSLLFIAAASSLMTTAITALGATALSWRHALILTTGYFFIAQLHIAMWVDLYKEYAANYQMSPVRL